MRTVTYLRDVKEMGEKITCMEYLFLIVIKTWNVKQRKTSFKCNLFYPQTILKVKISIIYF